MNSRLYECSVLHARLQPTPHRFVYRLFLLAIDLDEIDEIDRRLRLLSVNRSNLYSFRESDHLPSHEPLFRPSIDSPARASAPAPGASLKQRVTALLAAHAIDLDGGRVELVTLPRIAGYLFNPVSFYFAYDRGGAPVASIAEVTNTFRETKLYVLGPTTCTSGSNARRFRLRVPKHFYVSPFSEVDVAFDFDLQVPGERLALQIDDYAGADRTLTSTLAGPARPLDDRTLAWFSVKYPLLTLKVIAAIHWQALRLYLKRAPWFRKAARSSDQRDLHRPHASLTASALPDHR